MSLKIYLDPGHGGEDNGAAYGDRLDYVEEDDLNLIISFLLRYELKIAGHSVVMSREKDEFVSLSGRTADANARQADIFVSIHCDAWHQETTRGMSTHIHPSCSPDARLLARHIHGSLVSAFPAHANRGIKQSNFHVLRASKMPAVLIECEFVTNPDTRRFLREPENQLSIARAIARGIEEYAQKRRPA